MRVLGIFRLDQKKLKSVSLCEAIAETEKSDLVRRALGDRTFERFIALKKQEWDDYRIQVTPYEIETFLPIM
ncbi:MAG: hypothetical protein U9N36_08085 [Euryarchaeota archaeon]|nr:hypothetical protein [Euryarchaeota archaeon]